MRDWAARLAALLRAGEGAALVSVLATEGSVPREGGTRMIVTADRLMGTIGGGNLEYRAIEQARAILALPQGSWRVQDYPLGPLLGQCCGGRVRLLVEHMRAVDCDWLEPLAGRNGPVMLRSIFGEEHVRREMLPAMDMPLTASARGERPVAGDRIEEIAGGDEQQLLLFGGGHVGCALASLVAGLPFALHWHDVRDEMGAAVSILPEEQLLARARAAGPDAMLLVMTHDHGLDYRLIRAALEGRAGFVGLIGSATKRARFLGKLRRDGFDEDVCARMVCPIGLPGVEGKEPEVIAVAVAAQLLSLRGQMMQNAVPAASAFAMGRR